jgi:hypothetical protein
MHFLKYKMILYAVGQVDVGPILENCRNSRLQITKGIPKRFVLETFAKTVLENTQQPLKINYIFFIADGHTEDKKFHTCAIKKNLLIKNKVCLTFLNSIRIPFSIQKLPVFFLAAKNRPILVYVQCKLSR